MEIDHARDLYHLYERAALDEMEYASGLDNATASLCGMPLQKLKVMLGEGFNLAAVIARFQRSRRHADEALERLRQMAAIVQFKADNLKPEGGDSDA